MDVSIEEILKLVNVTEIDPNKRHLLLVGPGTSTEGAQELAVVWENIYKEKVLVFMGELRIFELKAG